MLSKQKPTAEMTGSTICQKDPFCKQTIFNVLVFVIHRWPYGSMPYSTAIDLPSDYDSL